MWDSELLGMGIVMIIVLVVCAAIMGVVAFATFPGAVAEIEQVRAAVAAVGPEMSEDVYGQAVEANRAIAVGRRYTHMPVIGILIPNGWDDVAYIDLTQ